MAVSFDAVGPAGGAGTHSSASPLTWTHVNGGNCILVGFANSAAASNPVTAVTYGGVSIPLLGAIQTQQPDGGFALYGLAGATVPTGSNTVSVTFTTGSGDMIGGSVSASGVGSLGTAVTGNSDSTGSSFTVSVASTTTGGMVVVGTSYGGGGGSGTFSGTNGVTIRVAAVVSSAFQADNEAIGTVASTGGGANQTVGISDSGGADWFAMVAVELLPAAAAAGVPSPAIPPGRQSPMAFQFLQKPPVIISSAVVNPLSLTASAVAVSSPANQVGRLLTGIMTVTSAITRSAGRGITAITVLNSSITRALSRGIAATAVLTATAVKQVPRSLAGVIAVTSSVLKSAGKPCAAALTATGSLTRSIGRILSASVVLTAAVTRSLARALLAVVVVLSVTAFTKVKLMTVSAVMAVNASITRSTGRLVSGTMAVTASLSTRTGRLISATVAVTAATLRSAGKIMSAIMTATAAVTLIKVKLITLAATTAAVASVKMSAGRILTATAVANAAVSVRVGKIMAATAAVFSSVTRSCGRALRAFAVVTGTASALRVHLLALAAQVALRGAQAARTGRLVAAQVIATATAGRGIPATIRALLTVTAKSVTGRAVVLKAVITSSGSVLATVMRPVGLIIFKLGLPAFRWVAGNVKKQWRVP